MNVRTVNKPINLNRPGFVGDFDVLWVSRSRSGGIAVVSLPKEIHDEPISGSFSLEGARLARNETARKARRRRSCSHPANCLDCHGVFGQWALLKWGCY